MNKLTKATKKFPVSEKQERIGTIQDLLEKKSSAHPDAVAYSIRGKDLSVRSITFAEVFSLSKRFATRLEALGLEKGDHVAILGENSPQWAVSYFSVVWAGAVAVPLDARATEETTRKVLALSDARFLVVSAGFLDNVAKEPGIKAVIPMEEAMALDAESEREAQRRNVEPEDLAEIVFTSGTTGSPRGAMLSHGNIMSNVETVSSLLPVGKTDTAFSILPIHHVYERICGILLSFRVGQRVFFSRSIRPREMLEDLVEARPTMWLNTPAVLERLIWRIDQAKKEKTLTRLMPKKMFGKMARKRLGLDRLRLIVSGGAALSERACRKLEEYGFPLIQGYGMSETAAVVSANPFQEPRNLSAGMILENVEAEIRDPDSDGNGEICVRGPAVMKGYYNNPEETREVLSGDGWLKTGDLGYFDADGYLYITGRKKSVIVTQGGKNISPEEIEEKLAQLETVEESVVFSPDSRKILAVIFPRAGSDGTPTWEVLDAEIRKLNRSIEPHKRIFHFALSSRELPKTTTRKVKRYLFRGMDIQKTQRLINPPEEK